MLDLDNIVLGYNKNNTFINLNEDLQIQQTKLYPLRLTLEDIHNQLKQVRFNTFYQSTGGSASQNANLEAAKLIPFNLMYYYLFITKQQIPTPQLLTCEYVYRFCEPSIIREHYYSFKPEYKQQGYSTLLFTLEELTGRICRAYNSFNREVELAFRIMEDGSTFVRYNFQKDYVDGVDLEVKYCDKLFGIICSQKNMRTDQYRVAKETTRRSNYDSSNKIYMAIDRFNHDTCGDIWIFSQIEYERLRREIKGKERK